MADDTQARVRELLAKRDSLVPRLSKGRERIRIEQDRGGDKLDYYFEFWLALLTDYEQTMDSLRKLGVSDDAEAAPSG